MDAAHSSQRFYQGAALRWLEQRPTSRLPTTVRSLTTHSSVCGGRPARATSVRSRSTAGREEEVPALPDRDGVGISHSSSVLARVVLRPRPSTLDGMERQRMMYLVACFHHGHWPSLTNVESDRSRSTRLTLWTRLIDKPQQSSRPSTPWLVCRPDSRRVELQHLLSTH